MFGQGLVKGLAITLRELFVKKVTVQYPEQRNYIAPRYHGEFVLDVDKCINCGLCANACPNNVIQIESEKAEKKKIQTRFTMNLQYCLFCGLCVEACAKSAIRFSDKFEMAKYHSASIPLLLLNKTPEQIAEEKTRIMAEAARAAEAKAKAEAAAAAAKPEAKDAPKPDGVNSKNGKAEGTEG